MTRESPRLHTHLANGLHWVRGELDQSLSRARQLIEQYVDAPEDQLPLQQAVAELHQVRGTASMIQACGVAALAEEMKQTLQDLMQQRIREPEPTYAALMGASVQLGDYIDALAVGQDDCVLVLQPALNELRLSRGRAVQTEEDLFVAQMQTLALHLPPPENTPATGTAQAQKLLALYQQALLAWFKNQDEPQNLGRIGKIAEIVAASAGNGPLHQLWRTVAASVEALLSHTLEDSIELKRLFGRSAQQLKLLAESGEDAAAAPAAELSYSLLFFVGRSRGQGPRVAALRRSFQLSAYLPGTAAIEELRRRLRGPNTLLLNRVAEEVRADFVQVKDAIDLALRVGDRAPPDMAATRERLQRVSDTLSVLGLTTLQRVVANQARMLDNLQPGDPAAQQLWMDLATSVLRVEHSLEDALFRQLHKPPELGNERAELDEHIPSSADLREGIAALWRESLVNLAKLKAYTDAYIRNGDAGGLTDGVRLLGEIASGFRMLESPRAARLVVQLQGYLQSPAFAAVRDTAGLAERFADAVAAVEYYIEAVRDELPRAAGILDDLAGFIEQLEYVEEAPVPEKTAEPAATPDPAAALDFDPASSVAELPPEPAEAEPVTAVADEVDPEIREVFLEEAAEVLQVLQRSLPRWVRDTGATELLGDIRRAFHTLKGSGRMVGASHIGEYAWAVESLLNRCIDGAVAITPPVVDVVRDAVRLLPALIEGFRNGTDAEDAVLALGERAQALAEGREENDEPDIASVFRGDAQERLDVVASWLAAQDRSGDTEAEVPADVVRAFHTLRGAAHVVNAPQIGDLAAAIETYLDSVRGAGLMLPLTALTLLDDVAATLRTWVSQVGRAGIATPDLAPWLARIEQVQSAVPDAAVDAVADRQLAEIFAIEAFELVQKFEQGLAGWASAPDAQYHARELRSLLHTLRGAALMSSCAPIAAVAQALFERVGTLLEGPSPKPAFFADIAAVLESLYQMLDAYRDGLLTGDGAALAAQARGEPQSGAAALPAAGQAQTEEAIEIPPVAELDDDAELRDIFFEEASELLQNIAVQTTALEREPQDRHAAAELRRAFHTIKGSARMSGLHGMGEAAHRMEVLMDGAGRGQIAVDGPLFARLRVAAQGLGWMLDEARRGGTPEADSLLSELESPLAPEPPPAVDNGIAWQNPPSETIKLSGDWDDMPSEPRQDAPWQPAVAPEALIEPSPELLPAAEPALELVEFSIQAEAEPALAAPVDVAAQNISLDLPAEMIEVVELTDAPQQAEPPPAFETQQIVVELPVEPPPAREPEISFADFDQPEPAAENSFDAPPAAPWVPPAPPPQPEWTPSPAWPPAPQNGQAEDGSADASQGFDDELGEIFAAESGELLESLDHALKAWRADTADLTSVREMQRVLHTLKGGARMAGLNVMGLVAHDMETRVNEVEQGRIDDTDHAFSQLSADLDRLQAMQDLLLRGDVQSLLQIGDDAAAATGTVHAFDDAAPHAQPAYETPVPPPAPHAPEAGAWDPQLFWRPDDERIGLAALRRESARVPVEHLDDMLNQAGEISIYRSRLEEHNSSVQAALVEMTQTITRLREQLRMLDIETEAQISARGIGHVAGSDRYDSEFDPLEMDRYSRMQELSRALSETVGDLSSLHTGMDQAVSESETLLQQQGRTNTEVQTGLMGTLMVPFSRQVQRLQRVVRQVAQENGKQAEAKFEGVESELDRNVLERMTAPLEHLLRNSIVHGIETPEQRMVAGKPVVGTVSVSLRREGTQLLIELRDDGKGLDFAAIRDTAIRRGLMPADALVPDEAVAQFIFAPGFSTARQLTQDAGRGIGMDVVAAEVKQLGGTLELGSETGKGARFLIRLPLNLAISQALMVSVGGEMYAVPLPSIEGIARIPREQLADYYREGGPQLVYGSGHYRVQYLGDLIGVARQPEQESRTLPAILVRMGEGLGGAERRVAVVIDKLHGNRELVSKAVGPQISSIAGVSGATILANGQVLLILDVPALTQDVTRRALLSQAAKAGAAAAEGREERKLVMVVDDSITMRRVAERLLLRNGFSVLTAKDGLDAMAKLQTETPAAILLDIEMPRADGFEVAAFVRNSSRIAQVPIVMITSRSGEKHRERARSLGVNRYLIKPYQEEQLMSEVRSVLAEPATA